MEQQQQMDEKFMSDNGWQCVPYTSLSVPYQTMMMKRDKKSSGSARNPPYEDDGDSELVRTIKRLRRNKINCQPRSLGLSVNVQAMMMRGPMSMTDAIARVEAEKAARVEAEEAARVAAEEAARVAAHKQLASTVANEAADEVASRATRETQDYFTDLRSGRYTTPPSSPIDIPRKKGGKKRSYKKRTNAKKRSYKKRTNAKKRSYKKRTNAKKRSYKKRN